MPDEPHGEAGDPFGDMPDDPFADGLPPDLEALAGAAGAPANGGGDEGADDGTDQPGFPGFPGLTGFPGLGGFPGLPGLPDLGDLGNVDLSAMIGMLASPGPINWEMARQIARQVAAADGSTRVDPAAASEYAELARAAQAHVAAVAPRAGALDTRVRVCTAVEWADTHLDSLRTVLEALATTLGAEFRTAGTDAPSDDPFAAILPMLAPMLLGLQAGSLVGHLAQHALGRYDLPLPTTDAPSLVFVAAHVDAFAEAWSLPRADLRFALAAREVVHASVRSEPWVRERLVALTTEYVQAYDLDLGTLEDRFGALDPADPASLEAVVADPAELLGAIRSPAQDAIQARLRVLATVLEGYADTVLETVVGPLLPTYDRIHEAVARHRIERGEAGRFAEALLGLDLARDDVERGVAFCRGVVERAGTDGLDRLWNGPDHLPTVNELEAPGLWLARIDLDEEHP